jgi:FkbM family methyltransferase
VRLQLLYDPRLLIERVAELSLDRRRRSHLRNTPGAGLRGALLDTLELLKLLPHHPAVIYDIGANTGTWTLLAKSIYRAAEIVAFEPLDWHCLEFERTTAALQTVTLHRVALGSRSGQFDMKVPTQSDSASLLPLAPACKDVFGLKFDRNVPVKVERLDDYAARNKLSPPDLMKLDVQGFEIEVLLGGAQTLKCTKAVIVEVSFKEFYKGQCRFDEVVSFLAEAGLHVNAFGARTALGKPLDQCDVLFLRPVLAVAT